MAPKLANIHILIIQSYGKNRFAYLVTGGSSVDELNSERRIEKRHLHNRLKDTSNGIMILGIWSTFKTFMLSGFNNDLSASGMSSEQYGTIGMIIVFLIVLLIDFRFRLVIWRGARKEAYGRDTNNRYFVFAFILIIFSGMSMAVFVYSLLTGSIDDSMGLASFLIEITSFGILCELVHSGLKLRKIRSEEEVV